MKKLIHISFILILSLSLELNAQDVPATVQYCDIQITLSPDAQTRIQEYYRQITASPRYFNEMVKRAEIYMPFIEEAFAEIEVPLDLKYLAIQESALRADVVSSSKAVGFWQMKDGTAGDLNLQVDNEVDERMHIYQASKAAARYLKESNRGYANWIYALLSYYEGPTGSVPYTNPDYYGEKSMNLSANDHWYVLKAIANKLAYEKALSSNERPEIFLMPFLVEAGTPIKNLLAKHKLSEEEFFRYNKWIHNKKRISRKKDYTYYISQTGNTYIGHVPDPVRVKSDPKLAQVNILEEVPTVGDLNALQQRDETIPQTRLPEGSHTKESEKVVVISSTQSISQPTPVNPDIFVPKAIDIESKISQKYVEFQLRHDLHYGREYVSYSGYTRVAEIADRYKKNLSDFLLYNGLIPGREPEKGQIIYIEKPEKRSFYIVREGESLTDIAAAHMTSIARIQNRNRMASDDFTIFVGQKLYLKDRKPKDEQLIVLSPKLKEEEALLAEEPKAELMVEPTPVLNPPADEENEKQIEEKEETPTGVKLLEEKDTQGLPEKEMLQTEPKQSTDEALAFLDPNNKDIDFKPVWVEHIVVNGETLWQISQKYGSQVDLIKKINKLENDEIIMGQSLRVLATKKF